MGVIHKLKQEVVQFIVQKKKDLPQVSCRKMADFVHTAFELNLSKSAINNILQRSTLSSPVGRRPQDPGRKESVVQQGVKAKSFKIPDQKKILGGQSPKRDCPPPGFPPVPPLQPSKSPLPPVAQSQRKFSVKRASSLQPKEGLSPKGDSPPKLPKTLYDHMGSIFLKAAEWEISDGPLLGKILKDHLPAGFSQQELEQAGEVLLFLQVFGIKRLEDFIHYTKDGLWAINGLKTKIPFFKINDLARFLNTVSGVRAQLQIHISQLVTKAAYIKVVFKAGNCLWVDALGAGLSSAKRKGPNFSSINQITTTMINQWLMPREPLILGAVQDGQSLYHLAAGFANDTNRKLHKIMAFGYDDQEIIAFDSFIDTKRSFLVGLWPSQEFYQQLFGSQDFVYKKNFEMTDGHKQVAYDEMTVKIKDPVGELHPISLRAVGFEMPGNQPQMGVILTNMSDKEMTAAGLISAYVQRWPCFQESKSLQNFLQPNVSEEYVSQDENISNDLSEANDLHIALNYLNRYGQEAFFPSAYGDLDLSSMTSIFYNIAGYLQCTKELVKVELIMPREDYPYQNDLALAVRKVNERNISDFQGRKLFLSCL